MQRTTTGTAFVLIVIFIILTTACSEYLDEESSQDNSNWMQQEDHLELVLQAEPDPANDDAVDDQMKDLLKILEHRVDPDEQGKFLIEEIEGNRIRICIPAEYDTDDWKAMLCKKAHLQFIDAQDDPWKFDDIVNIIEERAEIPEDEDDETTGKALENPWERQNTYYVTPDKVILDGKHIKSASVDTNQFGEPKVDIVFDDEGRKILADHTTRNIGRYLAVILDGKVISAPVINSVIPHGKAHIAGSFSLKTAHELAVLLNSRALPVPVTLGSHKLVKAENQDQ